MPAVGAVDEILASNGFDRYVCSKTEIVLPRGSRMLVRGWAAEPGSRGPTATFRALLDDREIDAHYRESRTDVAAAYGRTTMRNTGFRLAIDTSDLPLGPHLLQLASHERGDDECFRELETISFVVSADGLPRALRALANDLFAIEVSQFCSENPSIRDGTSQLEPRIEIGFLGIVRGTIRERKTGKSPAHIFGVVDGFDIAPGQLGYGVRGERFVLCAITDELGIGDHILEIFAVDEDERLASVATLPFSITPICCAASQAIASPEIARAEIAWVDRTIEASDSIATFARGTTGHVRGWAFDPIARDAAGTASLAFDGGRRIVLRTRQYRPDLAHALGSDFCGFVGSIAFDAFEPGRHVGRVRIESKDGQRMHETTAHVAFEVIETRT